MTGPSAPSALRPPQLAGTAANAPDPFALLDSLATQRTNASSPGASSPSSFDPVDFLNQHYRSEALLTAQLPRLRDAVSQRIDHLDDQIAQTLIRQSETAASTRQHVQDATAAIQTLEQKIRLVQEKAAQSEKAVLSITADMKVLDHVKTHLQRCITTLKQLHMLVHATEQLRQTSLVEEGFCDYGKASQLVQAIRLLLTHFAAAQQARVLPLRQLATLVQTLQNGMHSSLKHGFRVVAFGSARTKLLEETKLGGGKPSPLKIKPAPSEDEDDDDEQEEEEEILMPERVLQGGIKFMEALGDPVWTQFRHEFCLDCLSDYSSLFEPPNNTITKEEPQKRISSFKKRVTPEESEAAEPPAGRLENIEERFHWFRQEVLQKIIQDKFSDVFPASWQIEATLARLFLKSTHSHLTALLDPNGQCRDKEAGNAPVLLKALQKTLVFEREITGWLERERGTVFKKTEDSKNADDTSTAIDPLIGVASVAFENHMGPYIALEEKSMEEQLAEALEDRTVDNRGERPVLISSTNLFVYIKGSITRCTALTKGKAFFLLYRAFQASLKKYAHILQGKLPPQISNTGVGGGGLPIPGLVIPNSSNNQSNPTYRIPPGEEVTVCHIISTCQYCADTVEALEDLIRDTIDQKYQEKIDMTGDQDSFHEITAQSIRVLVSGLINRIDPAFKDLSSIHWANCSSVGEESDYVRKIHEQVEPFIRAIRSKIPTSYFRSFCDKFAAAFTATYYDTTIRLKRISGPGTQQLLLDVYNLKTLFLKLPVLEEEPGTSGRKPATGGSTIAPAMYTKLVQKQFGKIETLLKLVGTPNDLLIDNFKVQWVGGSALDFQVVMSLKGMKRPEQVQMLEKFGLDPQTALRGAAASVTSASIVSERVQSLQDQGSNVAAKVSSEMNSMRQKVDDLRRAFRPGQSS